MKSNRLVRFFAVISLFFSVHSVALPQISPYQGLVPAEDSNEDKLREEALEQVLIKVSGNVDIVKLDGSKTLAKSIPDMLAQFGYQDINDKRFYFALFEKQAINSALIAMQQPIWGETRPSPLIWLVNEDRQLTSENMVDSSQDGAISWGLNKSQIERGITGKFPLVDLDDLLTVSVSDVSGRFYQTVADASKRYDAEYFVLANLTSINAQQWQLKWELVQYNAQSKKNQVLIKQTSNGDKAGVMSTMLGEIADYYAKQFAILENNGARSAQLLNINNINSLEKLMSINDILNNLNSVESFEVVSLNDKKLEVLVTLKGSLASLENALNAQPKLQKDLISTAPFYYNWQP
ncbi:DUF2066 domain-containing protein [Psychromonas sp. SP041]|uniref:DUF2066 domain-containing protein n=1 Tax=Psychromonas sp. SP041 TaxID=1365007 RepID=UPI00041B81F2|nr:DUF2066 domain-containing protein [Psychromonas sp. SP041]